MNVTLFVAALRQRFSSPVRAVLLGCTFLFPLLFTAVIRGLGLHALGEGTVFAFLLGAGIIGQDTASGVMQLLFARPVRRREYVVSRWLATALGASILSVVQIALGGLLLLAHGAAPPANDLGIVMAQQIVNAFGTASVLLIFSSLVSGVGDVIGVALTFIMGQIVVMIGQFQNRAVITRIGEEIQRFVVASVPVAPWLASGSIPWVELVSYVSTVTLCLGLAIVILDRREISYASG